jgi:hypothetical protein
MSLDTLLSDAVSQAIHLSGSRIYLKGGLKIEMVVENSFILHLTLSRDNQVPSQTEWETVSKYFPWPITVKPMIIGYSMNATLTIHPKYFIQPPLPQINRLC